MTQFNMIDSSQGPDPKRLLVAVAVSSAILMAYTYFFQAPPTAPLASERAAVIEPAQQVQPAANGQEQAEPQAFFHQATKNDIPEETRALSIKEGQHSFSARSSYRAQVSNRGGVISDYSLTDFSHEKPLLSRAETGSLWLGLHAANQAVTLNDQTLYEITASDSSSVTMQHVTKEGLRIERHYQFNPDGKMSETIKVSNLSPNPLKAELVLSALKSGAAAAEPGLMNPGVQGEYLVVKSGDKHERLNYNDLLSTPKSFSNFSYIGFDDQFFLSAFLPKNSELIEKLETSVKEKAQDVREARFDVHLKSFVLMQGEEKSFSYDMFMGPKQVELLASVTPPLDENIDFGWFGVLSRPMLWLLVQIYGFVHNYGIAIILITFIIKLLTYPLTAKSFQSQQSMKVLQPKLKELQQKFGHDRTLLGQKQMELYRTHGINPVAGCLPMLIQLPIWFAFFQMLRSSVELFDQPFYWWIRDLTHHDPYYVLPVLMGASMLVQQFFTPPPSDQPQMKYVMYAMPLFLTFIMLKMPSGLSLYILTNNLLTIVQQIIIKRQSSKVTA